MSKSSSSRSLFPSLSFAGVAVIISLLLGELVIRAFSLAAVVGVLDLSAGHGTYGMSNNKVLQY